MPHEWEQSNSIYINLFSITGNNFRLNQHLNTFVNYLTSRAQTSTRMSLHMKTFNITPFEILTLLLTFGRQKLFLEK